jgi:putative transposase
MNWLTLTHTQRYRHAHGTVGHGAVYQGRFKSFPVQADRHHFLILCRYVERNPLRAALVQRAEDWRWSGLWRQQRGDEQAGALLSEWPVERPAGWPDLVNDPQTDAEVEAVRTCVRRGRPLGQDAWQRDAARRLGLEASLRPPGRPRKVAIGAAAQ